MDDFQGVKEKPEDRKRTLRDLVKSWIEPSLLITDIQQRHQARLLAAILILLIPLGSLSAIIQLFVIPGFFPTFLSIMGGVSILVVAYIFSRSPNYLYGAILTCTIPFVVTFASLLNNPDDLPAFAFLIISVLLSSILLNLRQTISFMILNEAGIFLLPALSAQWTFMDVIGAASSNLIISILVIVAMWHRDLIERDRSLELSRSRARFQSLAENAVAGIIITNTTGKILYVNPTLVKMFGYASVEEFMSVDVPTLYKDPAAREPLLKELREEGSVTNFEIEMSKKSGETITVIHSTRIEGDMIFGTVIDISDRKEAENKIKELNANLEENVNERTQELRLANQELDAFAYSVSHDLRAPLRGIDGFSQMLLETYSQKLDESGHHYLSRIHENVHRMSRLIDDLLHFSRMNRHSLKKQRIDMNLLFQEVLDELYEDVPERQIKTSFSDLPPCQADSALIRQVVVNLLSNAIKYTSLQPVAYIEAGSHKQDGKVVYFIRDNGVGFDMRYANKLFGIFQRLHHADEFEGTGVGLAIVHRILQRHGGSIWAEAEVGKGTTFYFNL